MNEFLQRALNQPHLGLMPLSVQLLQGFAAEPAAAGSAEAQQRFLSVMLALLGVISQLERSKNCDLINCNNAAGGTDGEHCSLTWRAQSSSIVFLAGGNGKAVVAVKIVTLTSDMVVSAKENGQDAEPASRNCDSISSTFFFIS